MIPVRTSDMLVCGALASLPPCEGVAAVPKRWPLVMLAISMPWWAASVGLGGREFTLRDWPPPARSVTIIAACTPSASASAQVAMRGPRASARARHWWDAGIRLSQEPTFMAGSGLETPLDRYWAAAAAPELLEPSGRHHTGPLLVLSSNCFHSLNFVLSDP